MSAGPQPPKTRAIAGDSGNATDPWDGFRCARTGLGTSLAAELDVLAARVIPDGAVASDGFFAGATF